MKKGFTLIELLVVVLIIGILSAVALPQYEMAVKKSRMTQIYTLAADAKREAELFYLANGRYPTSFLEMDVQIPGCTHTEAYLSSCPNSKILAAVEISNGSLSFNTRKELLGNWIYYTLVFDNQTWYPYPSKRFCRPNGIEVNIKVCKALSGKAPVNTPFGEVYPLD